MNEHPPTSKWLVMDALIKRSPSAYGPMQTFLLDSIAWRFGKSFANICGDPFTDSCNNKLSSESLSEHPTTSNGWSWMYTLNAWICCVGLEDALILWHVSKRIIRSVTFCNSGNDVYSILIIGWFSEFFMVSVVYSYYFGNRIPVYWRGFSLSF